MLWNREGGKAYILQFNISYVPHRIVAVLCSTVSYNVITIRLQFWAILRSWRLKGLKHKCTVCFFCHSIWNYRAVLNSIRNVYTDSSKNKSTWKNRHKALFRILVLVIVYRKLHFLFKASKAQWWRMQSWCPTNASLNSGAYDAILKQAVLNLIIIYLRVRSLTFIWVHLH